MEIGVVCNAVSRRWAVTTTSSRPWAKLGVAAPVSATTTAAAASVATAPEERLVLIVILGYP